MFVMAHYPNYPQSDFQVCYVTSIECLKTSNWTPASVKMKKFIIVDSLQGRARSNLVWKFDKHPVCYDFPFVFPNARLGTSQIIFTF